MKKPGPRQARALPQGHRAIRGALFRTHLPGSRAQRLQRSLVGGGEAGKREMPF